MWVNRYGYLSDEKLASCGWVEEVIGTLEVCIAVSAELIALGGL